MLRLGTYIKAVRADSYVRLQLCRPEARNALSDQVIEELNGHLQEIEKTDARCIVITGTEGVFASGGDLKQMMVRTLESVHRQNTLMQWDRIAACSRVLIGAVNGFALGGGLQLAMMCDIRFSCKTAKFGHPELGIGTLPGAGGTQRLTRLIGKARAMDMILTGRIISAEEAFKFGLVTRICEEGLLETQANELAARLGKLPLETVLDLKSTLRGV